MNKQFDPYNADDVTPEDFDNVYFGGCVFGGGYQGVRIPDSTTGKTKLERYQSDNPSHQQAIANGKKVMVYYDFSFYPVGVSWNPRTDNLANFSKEAGELSKSLADVWGITVTHAKGAMFDQAFLSKLATFENTEFFAKWETEIEPYKDANGQEWKRYIKRVKELYPDFQTAQKAYDSHKGINGEVDAVPTGFENPIMERNVALGYIEALVKNNMQDGQCDLVKLQESIDGIAMLGKWLVTDSEIQAMINKLSVPF